MNAATAKRVKRVHPRIVTDVEWITPGQAYEALEAYEDDEGTKENPSDNRPLGEQHVKFLARQMKEGKWHLNGESIIFDWFDRLKDGQHRLWALIESKKRQKFVVVRGVDPCSFTTIDTGKQRSAGDLLGIYGEVSRNVLQACLRWIWLEERDSITTGGRGTEVASPQELAETLNNNPDVREWVRAAGRGQRILPPGPLSYCLYRMSQISMAETKIFMERVQTGANLSMTCPEFKLRDRFLKARLNKSIVIRSGEAVALITKAWNYRRTGKRVRILAWRKDEAWPTPR